MTANNTSVPGVMMVFSPTGRLVASSGMEGISSGSTTFSDLFTETESFQSFLEDRSFGEIQMKTREGKVPCLHLLMKDPSGKVLALILTLLESRIPQEVSGVSQNSIDEKMIQMDKMAKAGLLASSIAHEIRNPLAGISANVQVLADMLSDREDVQKFFEVILEEIGRVEKIIKDLLDYSRSSKPSLIPVSVQSVFDHVKTLVSAQLTRQKIKLDLHDYDPELQMMADFGQVIQVLLNCIMNASQAMPEGGKISIQCQTEEKYLMIKVRDSGLGISRDLLQKIFEPFFTTRAKGLGLGLSVTRKIMEDHGGKIHIESTEGHGTDVILHFPGVPSPL